MYWREYRTQFHIAQTYGLSEAAVSRIFDGPDRARDGGFAEAVGLGDMELGAGLAPVHQDHLHQRHQEPVFAPQLRREAKGRQVLFEGIAHRNEGGRDHPGQALEVGRLQKSVGFRSQSASEVSRLQKSVGFKCCTSEECLS